MEHDDDREVISALLANDNTSRDLVETMWRDGTITLALAQTCTPDHTPTDVLAEDRWEEWKDGHLWTYLWRRFVDPDKPYAYSHPFQQEIPDPIQGERFGDYENRLRALGLRPSACRRDEEGP